MRFRTLISFALFVILLPSFSYSLVLDDMSSIDKWETSGDGTSISLSKITGVTGNAVRMDFDFTSGNWLQMSKGYDHSDFSAGDSIQLYYKGTGNANNIELKLIDGDGDIFVSVLNNVTNTENWASGIISKSGFGLWTDSDGNPFGDGTATWSNVKEVDLNITSSKGGSGTLYYDKLSLYQLDTPSNKKIDECENLTNLLGNAVGTAIGAVGVAELIGTCTLSVESADPSPRGGNYYKSEYTMNDSGYIVAMEENVIVSGTKLDISTFSYLNFYLHVETGNEDPKIEIWFEKPDTVMDLAVLYPKDYKPLTRESWTFYSIPIADFVTQNASFNKEKIANIKIVVSANSGAIYADAFWFSTTNSQEDDSGAISVVEDFEDTINSLNYPTYADLNAEIKLSAGTGYGNTGQSLKSSYNFNDGNWIIIARGTGYNMTKYKGFKFKYKGTGTNCNLELKVEDTDGVVFIKRFSNFTYTNNEWKTAVVKRNELSFFSAGKGNDQSLNMRSIKNICLTVTKAETAGSGTFSADEFELMEDEDFEKVREGRVISLISIDNNPFSPNGDNVKDFATISYTLSDYAEMTFEVYGLAGRRVKKEELGEKSNGSHSDLVWNGTDDSGNVLGNGLYLYKLIAKDLEGQEDHIIHVIAVIK